MKMKKRLLLIINFICLVGAVYADEIELQIGDSWAVDGGIFKTGNLPVDYKNNGHQFIIKKADGTFQVLNVENEKSAVNEGLNTTVIVDRTPPVIATEWQEVIQSSNGIKIGPNSQVMLSVNEGVIMLFGANDEMIQVNSNTYVHSFNQISKGITAVAKDDFNNISHLNLSIQADFEAPQLSWQLTEPAKYKNNQWYAGSSAQVMLSAADETGIDNMLVNGSPINDTKESVAMNSGDNIQIVDTLGNSITETISWSEDNEAPYIVVIQDSQQLERVKNIKVAVNEVFEVQTLDAGVGLENQKYKGKDRKWKNLPKKFKFTSKGTYRIKVQSKDLVGNELGTMIKVKVKR